jgi:PAS domain S-box-containing protein
VTGATGTDETYRRAWQAAPLAILTLDDHARIRGCNPASERLFARPQPALVGQPMSTWCHALDRGALRQMLAEALTGRVPARQELRFLRPDGSEIVTGFSAAPTREVDGGVVCILRDLSSEKAFRPQLLHTERMASIGTVASVVAHELNNALAGAFGCLQLLPRPEDASSQELIDAVMGELRRAAEIVRELKGYARVEDGMNETVRIDELVERLQRLWRWHHSAEAAPELELQLAPGLPELRGNGNQLLQALLNLVRNAEQAVASQPEARQSVAIRARTEPGVLVIEVADHGPGVPTALRSRLFEPFYSTKPAGDGTGLGLTVVQAVAAGHGGRVEVDDTPGGGATFRLVLPLPGVRAPELEPMMILAAAPRRRLQGARVLVADDEPLLRRVVERATAAEGMTTVSVGGADEAKQALREHELDLVLLDVRMPGGGGAAVFRTILAEHPRLVPRTLFMSGEVGRDMAELVGQGHGGVLPKPFDLNALLDALESVLARASAEG